MVLDPYFNQSLCGDIGGKSLHLFCENVKRRSHAMMGYLKCDAKKSRKASSTEMLLLLPPCWCQLHANTRRVTYESSLWLRMAISNGIVFYSIHHTCLRKNNIVQQWLLVNEAACSWWSANSWKVVDMTSDNQAWCAKHKLSTKLRDPDWPIMTRAIHTIHTMTSMLSATLRKFT